MLELTVRFMTLGDIWLKFHLLHPSDGCLLLSQHTQTLPSCTANLQVETMHPLSTTRLSSFAINTRQRWVGASFYKQWWFSCMDRMNPVRHTSVMTFFESAFWILRPSSHFATTTTKREGPTVGEAELLFSQEVYFYNYVHFLVMLIFNGRS
jgi:hypothetical protein